MKKILGATALGILIIGGATSAGAQDINIYVYGEEGPAMGSGGHGEDRGGQMRGPGEQHRNHPGMHRGHGHHDSARDRGREEGCAHRGWEHGRKMHHGRGMHRVLSLIEHYDQDGDDKVTQAEIDKVRAERLAAFDSDGNGMLSLQEYEALWLDAMRERMVDKFQSHDDDGDGQVTLEEFSKRTSRLVMRRDRTEDGAISLEDMPRDDRMHHPMRGRDDSE